jgi:chemotaxis protein histidine kinase CheA
VTLVSGRGIGMDVIRSLAAEHGGSVVIASTPECGTELTVELPLAPPSGERKRAVSV